MRYNVIINEELIEDIIDSMYPNMDEDEVESEGLNKIAD